MSSQGIYACVGAKVATRVTHRSNLRAAFNIMGLAAALTKDGATYDDHLSMRTFEAHYEFYSCGA